MTLQIIGGTIVFILLTHFGIKFIKHKTLYPFMPFKYNFRRRRVTFKKALALLTQIEAKTLVETGTSRKGLEATKGDGAATIVFGKWAKENSAFLYSVDIDKDSVEGSEQAVVEQHLKGNVSVILDDSLHFLSNFNKPIDFLYLDSYDYSRVDKTIQEQSQVHHLKEFKLAEPNLHHNSIVLIDDCGLPGGGKGKLVIEYMIKNDWKILIDSYQILLVRAQFDT